ncbi:MAG: hypothetical protein Q4F31_10095 [Eubacteriales bacterium]|nr:hypothetical protein [Eubacteriales bacterium]
MKKVTKDNTVAEKSNDTLQDSINDEIQYVSGGINNRPVPITNETCMFCQSKDIYVVFYKGNFNRYHCNNCNREWDE